VRSAHYSTTAARAFYATLLLRTLLVSPATLLLPCGLRAAWFYALALRVASCEYVTALQTRLKRTWRGAAAWCAAGALFMTVLLNDKPLPLTRLSLFWPSPVSGVPVVR